MLGTRERGVNADAQSLDCHTPGVHARGCRVGDSTFQAGEDGVLAQMRRAATTASPAPAGVD